MIVHHRDVVLPASLLRLSLLILWTTCCFSTAPTVAVLAAEGGPGEGTDIEIGGPGEADGQFRALRDMVIDGNNHIYVLEGREWDDKAKSRVGNLRVQKFDAEGKFLSKFSVLDEKLSAIVHSQDKRDANEPNRLAVDSRGNVYVTQPRGDLVQQFSPAGRAKRTFDVPGASAVAVWKLDGQERIAVMGDRYVNNKWQGSDQVWLIDPAGAIGKPLALARPVGNPQKMAVDGKGRLHVLGDVNQVYQFDASGKLLAVIGGGTYRRMEDGSELYHFLFFDKDDNIYTWAWNRMARFDGELNFVTLKEGRFYWYDNWLSDRMAAAVDQSGRTWIATNGANDGKARHHFRPALLRMKTDWWKDAVTHDADALGLNATVTANLPYGVTNELKPITVELVIGPAFRRVKNVVANYYVYDVLKNPIAKGSFSLALEDGVEARREITFTPPEYGWYEIEFHLHRDPARSLLGVGTHVGVTPRFPGMPDAPAEAGKDRNAWPDIQRSLFCGLKFLRVNTGLKPEELEDLQGYADAHGMTLLVQMQGAADCEAGKVNEIVTRLKGKVKYWEIVNEPNFSLSPEKYVELIGRVYKQIKQIDPQAKVMGPNVCGMQLPWNEAFLKLGGGQCIDVFSIHDYEGNEAIDPGHWRYKFAELRKLMVKYGIPNHEIWQTERAIVGTRVVFIGGVQAVRAMLHRDLLETLGVPDEHNSFYYISDHGHKTCTSYLWGASGPHPCALTLRTREAMIKGRRFAAALDFGPTGNKVFFALRYDGADGSTITLRHYGAAADQLLRMAVKGGDKVDFVDAFGNARKLTARDGKVMLDVGPLPQYVRLAKGQELTPLKIDFGRNLAAGATFTFSGATKRDLKLINDGLFGVTHAGNPLQDKFWIGDWPKEGGPVEIKIALPQAQTVERMLLFSMRADNPMSFLLDFDLHAWVNGRWVTLAEVRTPMPKSDPVASLDSKANTWYMDQNFHDVSFKPTATDKLRITCRRATCGFMPDPVSVKAAGWSAGGSVQVNEIELYGPLQ